MLVRAFALLVFSTQAFASLDTEVCRFTSNVDETNQNYSSTEVAGLLALGLAPGLMNGGNALPPPINVIWEKRWEDEGGNEENETHCRRDYNLAGACSPQLSGMRIYKKFNKNHGGLGGTGAFSGDWDTLDSFDCPLAGLDTDNSTPPNPSVAPVVNFNQAMTSATQAIGSATEHIATGQLDPNGVQEAAANEGVMSKDGGYLPGTKGVTTAKANPSSTNSGSATPSLTSIGGSGEFKNVSLSNDKSTGNSNSAEGKVESGSGGYGIGSGSNGKRGSGDGEGFSMAATGSQGDMSFRGIANNINPNGSDDPENYFALIGLDENIFKKVEKRYRETANHWARVDLTKDGASKRDRALAAAKDPELSKPAKKLH